MADSPTRRALAEFAATMAALGAITVWTQLQDEASWLRLHSAELRDRVRELHAALRAAREQRLIDRFRASLDAFTTTDKEDSR